MNPHCPYCYDGEIVQQVIDNDLQIFFCFSCLKEVNIKRVGDHNYQR